MILAAVGEYKDDAGDLQTVRISSAPYSDDALGPFEPRIVEGSDPEYRSRVSFAVWGEQGGHTSYGRLEIINIDGSYDDWIGHQMEGHYWELRYGEPDLPWDELTLHFRAEAKSVTFDRLDRVVIEFRSSTEKLRSAVQVNMFSPATPNADIRDTRMPMIIGNPEHVPTMLLDASHDYGERYFVADNFNGTRFTLNGDLGGCKEGLATIPIVPTPPAAGEASFWKRGFDIAKTVTLPQTCISPLGPRKRLIPWLDAHFARWENDLPSGAWQFVNVSTPDEYYATRYGDLDALYIETELDGGSYTALRYPDVLEAGKSYTLRLHMMHVEGLTNRCELQIMSRDIDLGGASTMVNRQDVAWDDDIYAAQRMRTLEFDFEHTNDPGQTMLEIRFRRHSLDTLSRFVCLRIQLLPIVESGTGTTAGIMTRANELVPYLLLERGVKQMDGLPPDFEAGPLHASQIDYPALEQVTNEYPQLHLGWWWDDETTHEDLLNRIMSSYNAAWRFDRDDRLTAATLRAPEYFTGDVPTAAPVWHTNSQQVATNSGEMTEDAQGTLTVASPAGVQPGDLVVLMVMASIDVQDTHIVPQANGFTRVAHHQHPLTRVSSTLLYRVSQGNEPPSYTLTTDYEDNRPTRINAVIAARVTGADNINPFGESQSTLGSSQSLIGIGPTIYGPDRLVLSAGVLVALDGLLGFSSTPDIEVAQATDGIPGISGQVYTLAASVGGYGPGYSGDKTFTATYPSAETSIVMSIPINPAMPAEADIFTDRFELAGDRLHTAPDPAEGLSTLMGIRRNFRPIGEGEVAEASVPAYIRTRYRREWIQTIGAGPGMTLPPGYTHAIGAGAMESMIMSTSATQAPIHSRLAAYGVPRRWWQYTHLGSDVPAEPGRPGHITFPRYQLDSGKQLIITDVRHLPLSGRQELVCWG